MPSLGHPEGNEVTRNLSVRPGGNRNRRCPLPRFSATTTCFHRGIPPIEYIRNVSMKAARMNNGKAILKNILIP